MIWLVLGVILLIAGLLFRIRQVRKSSITGEKSRNKHFQGLAKDLHFQFVTDDYFVQLEGLRDNSRIIVYPHNFEGPGLVTLVYLETTIPATDRNWVEPNLSLGRALVEWKKLGSYNFEVTGTQLNVKNIQEALHAIRPKYPYIAITLPWRFSYSMLLQNSLKQWKNYAVFLAIDAGKHPATAQVEQALHDAAILARVTHQSVTFSDSTG